MATRLMFSNFLHCRAPRVGQQAPFRELNLPLRRLGRSSLRTLSSTRLLTVLFCSIIPLRGLITLCALSLSRLTVASTLPFLSRKHVFGSNVV